MKKVVFASYKGGVGRSQCLANVAIQLAKTGSRVGMVDLDFEAPGLHQVFDIDVSRRKSMIEVIIEERSAAVSKVEIDIQMDLFRKTSGHGIIKLLPGHCDEAKKLDEIRWDNGQKDALVTSIDQWQKANGLDYVLIDTRAGMSNAFASIITSCDLVVIVFRPNRQNIYGVKWMLKVVKEKQKSFTLVASPVPSGNDVIDKLVVTAISRCANEWHVEAKRIVKVPYIPELALDEHLIPNASGPAAPAIRSYQILSRRIKSEEII